MPQSFPIQLSITAVLGIPELTEAHCLWQEILDATADAPLRDGDVLAVTSKAVSKVEGRFLPAAEREEALRQETVRVVAHAPGTGQPLIVENRLGIVAAGAGIDASNVPGDRILLLPEDPDASARQLVREVHAQTGADIGVVITDTVGRPWRHGQTDIAIGCAGITPLDDARGGTDTDGKPLSVTLRCIADEIAAAADLVKGKASGVPVAVLRGLGHYVDRQTPRSAREILREADTDLFRLGSEEAYRQGFADGARSQ
ncbi:coenzyme F420-0:L-glutamate ligase [Nesterenkonia muleiensis]|uniref:coenzyme F420-0:L-glutamate ligase n=1 Tax=Nesterenkonia muleiensis TaxID=2282648 RepID=UPI001EE4BA22|nr:coenzyme F420-0:L-glutamate ligase [Nesterenkonia muleiensis]